MSEVKYKICSKCGAQMQIEEGVMTSSIPPMYRYHCPVCGGLEFDTEKYPMPEIVNDLTIHPYPDLTHDFDWQAFRAEAAKDIFTAIYNPLIAPCNEQVRNAIACADELIKQLKDGEK